MEFIRVLNNGFKYLLGFFYIFRFLNFMCLVIVAWGFKRIKESFRASVNKIKEFKVGLFFILIKIIKEFISSLFSVAWGYVLEFLHFLQDRRDIEFIVLVIIFDFTEKTIEMNNVAIYFLFLFFTINYLWFLSKILFRIFF